MNIVSIEVKWSPKHIAVLVFPLKRKKPSL